MRRTKHSGGDPLTLRLLSSPEEASDEVRKQCLEHSPEFARWSEAKLKAEVIYVNDKLAGIDSKVKTYVLNGLHKALNSKPPKHGRGGKPFRQGGRADGNKRDRWSR